MELQNQIYLITAIFGGLCTLLLVFIVVLTIYVINLKKTVVVKEPERKYENYGFEHDVPVHNITDDLRSMKSEVNRRPPPHKSNLVKPRNDDTHIHNNVRRTEKRPPTAAMGRDERKRQYSESGDTSGRDFDSAFDNEINNMFDIDDEDDDQSVVSDRNSRYNQQGRQKNAAPPPPSVGKAPNRASRNHQPQQMGRPMRGNGYPNSVYHSGNPHEGKTYFNERGMY